MISTLRGWRVRPSTPTGLACALALGGEDSNPQLQDQNLLCCRLHHPRRRPISDTESAAPRLPRPISVALRVQPPVPEDRGRRPRATSRSPKRRHSAPPEIGLVRVGEVTASRPTSSAMSSMRGRVVRIGDEHDVGHVLVLQELTPRRRATPTTNAHSSRAGSRRPVRRASCRYVAAGGRLGEAIPGLAPAGDDDHRRDARRCRDRARGRGAPRARATACRRTARRRARRSRPTAGHRRAGRLATPGRTSPRGRRTTSVKIASATRHAILNASLIRSTAARAPAQSVQRRSRPSISIDSNKRQPRGAPLDRRVEHLHVLRRLELAVLQQLHHVDAVVRPLARLDVRDAAGRARGRPGRAWRSRSIASGSISSSSSGTNRNSAWSAICTRVVERSWASATAFSNTRMSRRAP